jgi:hypothetical protein
MATTSLSAPADPFGRRRLVCEILLAQEGFRQSIGTGRGGSV